jgi:hypothetical protein
MANARAVQNQQLFAQAASIFGQMGQGVPAFTGRGGGGRLTAHLQNAIRVGQQQLADYRARQRQQQLQSQMQAAAKPKPVPAAPAKTVPQTLQTTLKSSGGGVRPRKSRQLRMQQARGVRESNPLQSRPYVSAEAGGGPMSTPYGSFINLA